MSYRAITIGAAMLLWAVPVAAQQRGTLEWGAFGSAGFFDKSLTLDRGVGAGGHIGVFLDPRWAIEFEKGEMRASRTLGLRNVNVGLLTARLVATPLKSGKWSLQLGAGAGASTETNFLHSYGVNGLLGVKIALGPVAALRIDGLSDWLANESWKSYQSVHVGVSFFRSPHNTVQEVVRETVRTVEVPGPAAPPMVQRPDSVSAAETRRLRARDAELRALRDSLSRLPVRPPSTSSAEIATMEERIQFGFDKSDLTDAAKATLDAKVVVFRANPTMGIIIVGHTDNMGTDAYNMALGVRRAEAAKAYLVSRGIAANRIEIDSKGEAQPVVSPTAVSIPANAPNRRDMFRIIVVGDPR